VTVSLVTYSGVEHSPPSPCVLACIWCGKGRFTVDRCVYGTRAELCGECGKLTEVTVWANVSVDLRPLPMKSAAPEDPDASR